MNAGRTWLRLAGSVSAGLLAGALVLAAPVGAAETTVTLKGTNQFSPKDVTVSVGDSVKFVWESGFHNVVFDAGPSSGEPVNEPGKTWSTTFSAPGMYSFKCEVHAPDMVGTVTVTGDASTNTTAASPTTTTTTAASEPTTTTSTTQVTSSASGGGSADRAVVAGAEEARSYPFTGPEGGALSGAGALLMLGGAAVWLRARRR